MNELIFVATSLLLLGFTTFSLRMGMEGLLAMMVVNLILVTTFGAKLISIFGWATNTGNVFYAITFFATAMIAEYYGRDQAYRSIWVAFTALVAFLLMSQFVTRMIGSSETAAVNQAIGQLFAVAPRISLASLVAFLLSQHTNIYLFDRLKKRGASLWQRNGAGVLGGQLLDSLVFFTIAFIGTLPFGLLIQSMIVGFMLKVIVGLAATPFFYLSRFIKPGQEPAIVGAES